MKTNWLMVIAVSALTSGGAWADTLQCGTDVVETGVLADELVAKCGEPAAKDIEGGNWTYRVDGHSYEVRVSASGVVAEINEVGE
jgi:hypothetical protein